MEAFDLHRLNKAPGIFDPDKLTWFNFEYIRRLPFETYLEKATPWFSQVLDPDKFDFRRLAQLMQERTEVFGRIPDMIRFLAQLPDYDVELYTHKKMKTNPEVARASLALCLPVLESIENSQWTETEIHDRIMSAIAESGMKNGAVLWPLRIAISGQASTPGGAMEIAYLLGREETLRRVRAGQARLENI